MTAWCRIALALAVAAAIGVPGCGGDDEADSTPTAGLTDYLPAESRYISVVDLDAARAELDLPADADPTDLDAIGEGGFSVGDPQALLIQAAVLGSPTIRGLVERLEEDALTEALDGAAISGLASNEADPDRPVSVIRTAQSFDDLAEALADDGYERDGEALTNPDAEVAEIADAGDGVLVLSGEGASAAELAETPPGGPTELVDLAAPDAGSIGLAAEAFGETCVVAFGGSEDAASSTGEFLILVDGTAEADGARVGALEEAGVETGEPTADGETVAIPFTADLEPTGSLINRLIVNLGFVGLYACE